jgi:hypothetical protein
MDDEGLLQLYANLNSSMDASSFLMQTMPSAASSGEVMPMAAQTADVPQIQRSTAELVRKKAAFIVEKRSENAPISI